MGKLAKLLCALSVLLVPALALAQDPSAGGGQDTGAGGGRGGRAQEPEIRPYDRVITRDAKSDDGIFTVHRIKDRISTTSRCSTSAAGVISAGLITS
jgi:hypothetical protein